MTQARPTDPEYERLFNAVSEAVLILDADGVILDANVAAAELFGGEQEDLIGESVLSLAAPDRGEIEAGLEKASGDSSKRRPAFEWWATHRSGALFPTLATLSAGRWLNQDVVIATFRRVGDRPRTSDEAREALETDRLRGLGQVAAGVAHDFNNALTAILGYAEAMDQRLDDRDFLARGIDVIRQAAHDATATVARIQRFAHGGREGIDSPVDLVALVHDGVAMTRPRWADDAGVRSATYTLDVDTTRAAWVYGKQGELREVLVNLIFNALDAMPEGGRVQVGVGREEDFGTFWVSDSGRGMPADVLTRIFDPFFSTKGDGGSGLGLAVSRGIIDRHGGSIEVESMPERGTTFTVRLPRCPEPSSVPPPAVEQPRAARVLLVDDETLVRHALTAMLERLGMEVMAVGDGVAALERMEDEAFDLVLTDLSMPTVSGAAVVAAVKERHPDTKVVLATGYADKPEAAEARLEADGFLRKPFTLEQLTGLLSELLNV